MTAQDHGNQLWYTRRDGEVRGPFPAKQISNYILLGRVRATDELSQDKHTWRHYSELPQLVPEVMRHVVTEADHQRVLLARLREDERLHDKRAHDTPPPGTVRVPAARRDRRHGDRRSVESLEVVEHRDFRVRMDERSDESVPSNYLVPLSLAIVAVVALVMYLLFNRAPPPELSVPDCNAVPAPGVNWSYCDMHGAVHGPVDLRGATLVSINLTGANMEGAQLTGGDLSYANLRGANLRGAELQKSTLKGAMLRNANLNGAGLEDADLSYANLRDANLDRARLDRANLSKATWIDGRTCTADSIGACR